jgi:release factor glutamine methyltransferase
MTEYHVSGWLKWATGLLSDAGIATARLDALVLLEDALQKDRAWLLSHPGHVLGSDPSQRLEKQIKRRVHHEPLAYIRGKCEFYGREFLVSPATLQPRSETEAMIELIKTLDLPNSPVIADIGTGSGAIAITTKLELPEAILYASDIQQDALEIARTNAEKHGANVSFYQGDLLRPFLSIKYQLSVILANLPYVPDSHTINQAAMQEPAVAIFGGTDGLDVYRQLFLQINTASVKPGFILTESLPFQHEALSKIANNHQYQLIQKEDFIQVFRLIAAA